MLPSHKSRYAITLWFIDGKERDRREAVESREEALKSSADGLAETLHATGRATVISSSSSAPSTKYITSVTLVGNRDTMEKAIILDTPVVVRGEVTLIKGHQHEVCKVTFPDSWELDESFLNRINVTVSCTCVVLDFPGSVYDAVNIRAKNDLSLSKEKTTARVSKKKGIVLKINLCYL